MGVYKRQVTGASPYFYELTDHLGNVRAVVSKEINETVAIKGATDYYPFGMIMPARNLTTNQYRYGYQGQEVDPETGKPAFQLRLWDARIGRWLTTDPAGQYASPYMGMGNNPIRKIDPDGAKADDWYEKLDENGNGTGVYDWFDGDFDIQGYQHLGFDVVVNNYDIDGNSTQIKFDGETKSSYIYNAETGMDEFLHNYDYLRSSTPGIGILNDWYNSTKIVGDQLGGALVNGVQGVGILLYEGIVNGRDFGGYDASDLGYEPVLDMTTTTLNNNGRSIVVNLHGNGAEGFVKTYARSLLRLLPFKANIGNNAASDMLISSQIRSRTRSLLE